MEQTVATLNEGTNPLTHSLIEPLIIKDVNLLGPGTWVGKDGRPTEYTSKEIRKGFENSDWENMNLFLDHKDSTGSAVAYWIGFVRKANMVGDELHGDLEIWHPLISLFIKQAKAKFAVSASMSGNEKINFSGDASSYEISSFRSMSLVDEPGCQTSWLPKMLSQGDKGDKKVVGGIFDDKVKSLANISSQKSEKKLYDQKEVIEMEKKEKTQKNLEEGNEEKTEEAEEKVEEKSEEKSEESNEEVKNLSNKIDKLTETVTSLSETIKTLAAKEEKAEEEKTEEAEEKSEEKSEEESKELESTKKDLEDTKKELAALKEEVNSPDKKTLATGDNSDISGSSANADMLGFLRESANISIY